MNIAITPRTSITYSMGKPVFQKYEPKTVFQTVFGSLGSGGIVPIRKYCRMEVESKDFPLRAEPAYRCRISTQMNHNEGGQSVFHW